MRRSESWHWKSYPKPSQTVDWLWYARKPCYYKWKLMMKKTGLQIFMKRERIHFGEKKKRLTWNRLFRLTEVWKASKMKGSLIMYFPLFFLTGVAPVFIFHFFYEGVYAGLLMYCFNYGPKLVFYEAWVFYTYAIKNITNMPQTKLLRLLIVNWIKFWIMC